jgi:hypothetical protein
MHDLANEVILGLSIPKRSLAVYESSKDGDWQIRKTKQDIVNATKMAISDNLLSHAITASFSKPKHLLDALFVGRPPVSNLWIEWDGYKAMKLLEQEYLSRGMDYVIKDEDKLQEKIGYLIQRSANGLYSYSQFLSAENKIATPPMSVFVSHDPDMVMGNPDIVDRTMPSVQFGPNYFQPVSNITPNPYLKMKGRLPEGMVISPSEVLMMGRYNLLSASWINLITNDQFLVDEDYYLGVRGQIVKDGGEVDMTHVKDRYIKWIMERMNFGVHAIGKVYTGKYAHIIAKHPGEVKFGLMNQSTTMMSGDMRLLFTMLGLLNYPQHIYEVEQKGPEMVSRKWSRPVPRNEVKVIEIDLPKPQGTKLYEKFFKGHGSPKRQHLRRGHWRVIHLKNGSTVRRWIEEQVVGDPELGVIDHDYSLVKKKAHR